MRNAGACLVLLIMVCGLCMISGCSTSNSSTGPAPASQSTAPLTAKVTPSASAPVPANAVIAQITPVLTATLPAATGNGSPAVPAATLAIPTTYVPAPDDPYVNSFTYNTSFLSVSNCVMQQAFPTIANDASYGTRSDTPHVTGISAEDMNDFYTRWVQGVGQMGSAISFNPCGGSSIPDQSWWDFIQVHAVFTPRNARPAQYEITLNVRSRNYGISQITYNETLALDQTVYFYNYIPLLAGQITDLQGIDLQFKKIPT
jgi:hypothetical protein